MLEVDDYSSGGPAPPVNNNYPPQNSAPPPRPQTTSYGQSINYNNYKQYVAPSPNGLAPPPINRQSKIITSPLQYDPQFNPYNNTPQQPVQTYQPNNVAPSKAHQNYPIVDNGPNFVSPRADSAPMLSPNQPQQFPKQPPKQMAKNPNGVGPKKISMPKQPAPVSQPSPNQYNAPLSDNSSPLVSPNPQPVPLTTGPNYTQPSPVQPNYPTQPKQPTVKQNPSVQPPKQTVISEPDDELQSPSEPGGKRPLTLGELYKLKNQAKAQQKSRDNSPQR